MSYCKSVSSSLSIRCWLSTEDHFIWVFLGPVVAIIVVSKDPFFVFNTMSRKHIRFHQCVLVLSNKI